MQDIAIFCGGFAFAFAAAPALGRKVGAPTITVHLLLGLLMQMLTGMRMPEAFDRHTTRPLRVSRLPRAPS